LPLLRIRVPLRQILLAWAVAIAIAQAAPAAWAIGADWFPLHAGNRWVYAVHRDHTYRPANDPIDRTFHIGRSTQVAESVTGRPPGAVLIQDVTVLSPTEGGSSESTVATRLFSFDGGLQLRGSSEARPHARRTEAVFDPPLQLLPTTTVGETWKVGTYREGDLRTELQGEVMGVENLQDPACAGCLKVRYRGKLRGSVPIYQGSAQIESGSIERVMWFERGVGIVREVTTTESQLKLPDGQGAGIFAVTTMRLVEHAVTK
jgi:hypothetical protein